jgi:hypothetical protein
VQELNQHHVIWGTPLLHHNVGKAIINHPYFDGLQHPFMVSLGMVIALRTSFIYVLWGFKRENM